MKQKWIITIIVITLVTTAGLIAWGPIVSNVEQPNYKIISSEDAIEIRQYDPIIVAQVTVKGERKEAISQGFRLLADYIFGNNMAQGKIDMTAPVMQQISQEIAMTAPVTQQANNDGWVVQFVMPSEYTLKTIPKPNNPAVTLKQIATRKFAVIRFSGMSSNSNIATHESLLLAFIKQEKLQLLSPPLYAFYNPPWTLPFLRRNEIMVEIK